MRIGIVGGGPAGLYFALLMKKLDPTHEIKVVEQNPAGATYGWGVVFSDKTLSYLEEADSESFRDISEAMEQWDDVAVVHRGEHIRIGGNTFSGMSRIELLTILQEHCDRAGVQMEFETQLTDLAVFDDEDLIVGADGVNSMVRDKHKENFGASVTPRPNYYVWYGTKHLFDALTLTFQETDDGVFVAHSYRYSPELSTFIVECDTETWKKGGFESMSEAEYRRHLEEVFKDDLKGHSLLSNKSVWINFLLVKNEMWHHDNIVLLGDAAHTAHFSIGSGTKLALEDSIALFNTFARHPDADLRDVLDAYEKERKPVADRLQDAAYSSMKWFESVKEHTHQEPLPFAYDLMTRSGRIDLENLKQRDPDFVTAYEQAVQN